MTERKSNHKQGGLQVKSCLSETFGFIRKAEGREAGNVDVGLIPACGNESTQTGHCEPTGVPSRRQKRTLRNKTKSFANKDMALLHHQV